MKQCQLWNFRKVCDSSFFKALLQVFVGNHANVHYIISQSEIELQKFSQSRSELEKFWSNDLIVFLYYRTVNIFKLNQNESLSRHERNRKLILRSKIPVPNSIPNCVVYLEKIFRKIFSSKFRKIKFVLTLTKFSSIEQYVYRGVFSSKIAKDIRRIICLSLKDGFPLVTWFLRLSKSNCI